MWYDLWIIIIPRILALAAAVAFAAWGVRSTIAVLTARQRVKLLRRVEEYEEYREETIAILKVVAVMAVTQLPDDMYLKIARLSQWKPGIPVSEKTYL